MAYRFLLEVPEALAADASVAVERAGDAQVILIRNSHGLGYDDPYLDLTVAAHSLRVVDSLYDWFDDLGASRSDLRIVLHGGDRLPLEAHDRGAMVAAIRRDQPWVERTLPKIGEHEEELFDRPRADTRIDAAGGNAPVSAGPSEGRDPFTAATRSATIAPVPERAIRLLGLNHLAVRVADLAKAERFYTDFFGMAIVGRARRGPHGGYQPIIGGYRWDEAVREGTEADVTFVRGGAVSLALTRAGRGARIDRTALLDHLSVAVDATTFLTLRGEVLLRGFDTLMMANTAITFRDPFGLTWELVVQGTPGLSS
jgi:catechol 2,3-dioxygenase-like lactoylglutathione lyase family enzyme